MQIARYDRSRGEQSEYRSAGDHVLDDRCAQVFVDDRQRGSRVLNEFFKPGPNNEKKNDRWLVGTKNVNLIVRTILDRSTAT